MNKLPVVIDTDGQLDSFWGDNAGKTVIGCKSSYRL